MREPSALQGLVSSQLLALTLGWKQIFLSTMPGWIVDVHTVFEHVNIAIEGSNTIAIMERLFTKFSYSRHC
jgi:hypothetical protein